MTGAHALTVSAYTALEVSGIKVCCALCHRATTVIGKDAPERAQMWLEDGGHYCDEILGGV